MKKLKFGKKEYIVFKNDELFKLLVEPIAIADTMSMMLKEESDWVEFNINNNVPGYLYLLKSNLEMQCKSAEEVATKLKKIIGLES